MVWWHQSFSTAEDAQTTNLIVGINSILRYKGSYTQDILMLTSCGQQYIYYGFNCTDQTVQYTLYIHANLNCSFLLWASGCWSSLRFHLSLNDLNKSKTCWHVILAFIPTVWHNMFAGPPLGATGPSARLSCCNYWKRTAHPSPLLADQTRSRSTVECSNL